MFIPLKVDVPMARRPLANWVLIGFTCLISIVMFGPMKAWESTAFAGGTDAHGVLNFMLLQPGHFNPLQLIGCVFLHANPLHLVGNMLFLYVFGNAVNAKLGHARYLALYFSAAIFEGVIMLLLGPDMPSLGASGATMGVAGAFLILFPLNSVVTWVLFFVVPVPAMFMLGVYFAFDLYDAIFNAHSGVAYLAHVAGCLWGAGAVSVLLHRKWLVLDTKERSLLHLWGVIKAPPINFLDIPRVHESKIDEPIGGAAGASVGNTPAFMWSRKKDPEEPLPPLPLD